jgi:hypothetical protein
MSRKLRAAPNPSLERTSTGRSAQTLGPTDTEAPMNAATALFDLTDRVAVVTGGNGGLTTQC